MDKKTQLNVWYVVVAIFAILMFQNWWSASRQVQVIPYSKFEELLKDGQIEEVYGLDAPDTGSLLRVLAEITAR